MQESFDRSAGILMPVSSLPSNYGIGTFGKCAYEFVDNLVKARQNIGRCYHLDQQVLETVRMHHFQHLQAIHILLTLIC